MKYLILALIAPYLAAQPVAPVEFDVVSIKPNKSGDNHSGTHDGHGTWRATNTTVKSILIRAFGVLPEQIVGAPAWVDSDAFDIEAKAEYDSSDSETMNRRLQAMLASRFQLQIHRETRQLQTYALLVGKKGAKQMTPAVNKDGTSTNTNNGHMEAKGITMEGLAQRLAFWLGRVTVNETGLEGRFDLTLDFEPERSAKITAANTPIAGVDSSKPTLMTAVQDQLGLKLESRKAPVEMLVVDRISRPSDN